MKAKAIGALNILHTALSVYGFLAPNLQVSWSYKTLEREHFCYIFLV